MSWRWLIEVQSERASGVYCLQRDVPSAMEVAARGESVSTTVFPNLRFGKTVDPEDRNLQRAPSC